MRPAEDGPHRGVLCCGDDDVVLTEDLDDPGDNVDFVAGQLEVDMGLGPTSQELQEVVETEQLDAVKDCVGAGRDRLLDPVDGQEVVMEDDVVAIGRLPDIEFDVVAAQRDRSLARGEAVLHQVVVAGAAAMSRDKGHCLIVTQPGR